MQHPDIPQIALPNLTFEAPRPPRDPVAVALAGLCRQAGVEGCALVDASTGTVDSTCGRTRSGGVWESATRYWQLYHRQRRHFAPWGGLRSAVFAHATGAIAVLPCCDEPPLVIVVCAHSGSVDWPECERLTHALGAALRSLLDRPLVQIAAFGAPFPS
jgi:hypothetical protein